jgi:hypothetical protein
LFSTFQNQHVDTKFDDKKIVRQAGSTCNSHPQAKKQIWKVEKNEKGDKKKRTGDFFPKVVYMG